MVAELNCFIDFDSGKRELRCNSIIFAPVSEMFGPVLSGHKRNKVQSSVC